MLNLTQEDREKLNFESQAYIRRVNLSIGSFFAKDCHSSNILGMLIAKKIFDIVGIKCPNSYWKTKERFILSEDLNTIPGFCVAENIGIHGTSLNDIQYSLERQRDEYKKFINVEELMTQVYIMHFIDILFSNTDRHNGNYGFILNEDMTGTLIVFDNDDFLRYFDKATRPLSYETDNDMDYIYYSKEAEAKYFFDSMPDENIDLFQKILLTFKVNIVNSLMSLVEKETEHRFSNKNELLKDYKKNYKLINNLLNSRKKDKNIKR